MDLSDPQVYETAEAFRQSIDKWFVRLPWFQDRAMFFQGVQTGPAEPLETGRSPFLKKLKGDEKAGQGKVRVPAHPTGDVSSRNLWRGKPVHSGPMRKTLSWQTSKQPLTPKDAVARDKGLGRD